MPKAKAQNNNDKSPGTAPKIADVTSDDSVGATASSRPVIVSNRPIMRDPMMVQASNSAKAQVDGDEKTSGSPTTEKPDDLSGAPLLEAPSVTKKKIVPPSEKPPEKSNQKPAEPLAIDEKAAEDTASAKTATKIAVTGVTIHDSIPEADKDKDSEKAAESNKTDDKKDASSDNVETTDNTESGEPSDTPESAESEEASRQAKAAEEIEAAETREATQAALVKKLVDSKAYVLPINSVQRRRSQQIAILGMFLIILLALAWLDLATDVGLLHVPYLPVTHFFGH